MPHRTSGCRSHAYNASDEDILLGLYRLSRRRSFTNQTRTEVPTLIAGYNGGNVTNFFRSRINTSNGTAIVNNYFGKAFVKVLWTAIGTRQATASLPLPQTGTSACTKNPYESVGVHLGGDVKFTLMTDAYIPHIMVNAISGDWLRMVRHSATG